LTRKTYAGYHTQETMRLNNLMLTAEAISSLVAADVRPPLGGKLFAWELLLLFSSHNPQMKTNQARGKVL